MNHRNSRRAMRVGMLPAGIAIALIPAFASAQEATADASSTTTLDRLEVTGSRIRGADMETQQPIITLSRQDIEKQGFTSVADILQNLTSAGSPAISRSDALASGENGGGYYIDIRNLGLIGAVELEPIAGSPTKRAFSAFVKGFEEGILIRTTGDIIAMSPPLIVEKSHIDALIGKLAEILKTLE